MVENKITEEGSWVFGFQDCDSSWHINYSSILTKLIQLAGRFTERYASDLFIEWKCRIEDNLKNSKWKSSEIRFGFYESGVHCEVDDTSYPNNLQEHLKNNSYYYRKVALLKVTIEDRKIYMELTW